MNKIFVGKYKDVQAVTLENDVLRAIILPESGSKLVSLLYKPLKYEALWQNSSKTYIKSRYGDLFESGDFSGFDEMFPTISRCFYETSPWAGTELPDHGEVWAIPWNYEIQDNRVRLWVNGVRLSYRLEKIVSLEEAVVKIDYTVANGSSFAMDYIWAAHPLFNASPGMELIVPHGMETLVNSVAGPRLQRYGKAYSFPLATLENGEKCDLSKVPEKNDSGYQKYYFAEKMSEGWCRLYDHNLKLNIGMSFPQEKVPYLGMWVNEGGWDGQYNIAPEPATGGMDRVDFAKMWGMNSVLKAHERHTWFLRIALKEGQKMSALNEDGVFQN
jgi:hypothetical protein